MNKSLNQEVLLVLSQLLNVPFNPLVGPFPYRNVQISLHFHILQMVESQPFHKPEASRRYPFLLIGHNKERLSFVWKPGNCEENSNRMVHPGGNLPEREKRKRKIYRYFVNGTTQSRYCFRCQKNTSTIWRKFFTEISVQMVSAQGVSPSSSRSWHTVIPYYTPRTMSP